jgi:hypothetical protein
MISRFYGILTGFAGGSLTSGDLIRLLAPSAPELKGQGVPPDQVYYIDADKTVTLRTRDPKIGIVWWIKPEDGGEIRELHVKPIPTGDMEAFETFGESCGLGAEARRYQNGALSDVQHVFEAVVEGNRVEVTVNEIVYSGDPGLIGKIGEVTVKKLGPAPRDNFYR